MRGLYSYVYSIRRCGFVLLVLLVLVRAVNKLYFSYPLCRCLIRTPLHHPYKRGGDASSASSSLVLASLMLYSCSRGTHACMYPVPPPPPTRISLLPAVEIIQQICST